MRLNDYVHFSCPIQGRNFEWDTAVARSYVNLYENGWLLTDENAALRCDASGKIAFQKRRNRNLTINQYFGSGNNKKRKV